MKEKDKVKFNNVSKAEPLNLRNVQKSKVRVDGRAVQRNKGPTTKSCLQNTTSKNKKCHNVEKKNI